MTTDRKAFYTTRLTELMEDRKLSRMDMVRQGGLAYPTIMRYENEELKTIDSNTIDSLMRVLKCSHEELVEFHPSVVTEGA